MSDWNVFQADVLDVLRQYEGFFDFFERVGSFSDNSRPDSFARVTRKDKKEIWVVDAKNKGSLDSGDKERMEKYLEMARNNPIDVGLDITEISEHEVRGIFITNREAELKGYEVVPINGLHQFMQKELVYTDTDQVIRKVSKMMERGQLSQSQARLMFQSLKPYEEKMQSALNVLNNMESEYSGIKIDRPPLNDFDARIPVDLVLRHEAREAVFFFDVPYTRKALENVEPKVEQIKNLLSDISPKSYYSAINTFETVKSSHVIPKKKVEQEVQETIGICSKKKIAEIFTPKTSVERNYEDNKIVLNDTKGLGFRAEVYSSNDVDFKVAVSLPGNASTRIKDTMLNANKEFGSVSGNRFQLEFQVNEDFEIEHNQTESFGSFESSIKSLVTSNINKELSQRIKKMEGVKIDPGKTR